MVCKKIYGVDLCKEVTAVMVRDAIIGCFIKAHHNVLKKSLDYSVFKTKDLFQEAKSVWVTQFIKFLFADFGGNFDKPTKNDLMKLVKMLKVFSTKYRGKETIDKHAAEIGMLLKKIKD